MEGCSGWIYQLAKKSLVSCKMKIDDDNLQEAAIAAVLAERHYNSEKGDFNKWIICCAVNSLKDILKARNRQKRKEPSSFSPLISKSAVKISKQLKELKFSKAPYFNLEFGKQLWNKFPKPQENKEEYYISLTGAKCYRRKFGDEDFAIKLTLPFTKEFSSNFLSRP